MEADHFGDDHRDRLAEHRRLRLDPADAPAQDAEAVDHGGVAVGADQRVGIGDLPPVLAGPPTSGVLQMPRAIYSRLTWWQMPVPGGTTAKLSNATAPHLRNW